MSCLFTFVREGMMCIEFNSVILFTVLYSQFLNCAKDVSKVTVQPTIFFLEYVTKGHHKLLLGFMLTNTPNIDIYMNDMQFTNYIAVKYSFTQFKYVIFAYNLHVSIRGLTQVLH